MASSAKNTADSSQTTLSKRFEKTPFALAGIPPASASRNAFAERGMAQINHHLRGNAFAAQALNDRTAPSLDLHPAFRQTSDSEVISYPRALHRAATPTLRDAIELREAQKRAAAVEDPFEASNATLTPQKKSNIKEFLTPITHWNPFSRRPSSKKRPPRQSLPTRYDSTHTIVQAKSSSDTFATDSTPTKTEVKPSTDDKDDNNRTSSQSLRDNTTSQAPSSIPPTPPAKNTPPTTTLHALSARFPFGGRARAVSFDESRIRRDQETGGILPYFGDISFHEHSPTRSATASNLALELLSPSVYSNPSAAPSPLHLISQDSLSIHMPSGNIFDTAPILRHKIGSINKNTPPRMCSIIAEEPEHTSSTNSANSMSEYTSEATTSAAATANPSMATQLVEAEKQTPKILVGEEVTQSVLSMAKTELTAMVKDAVDAAINLHIQSMHEEVNEKLSGYDKKLTTAVKKMHEHYENMITSKLDRVQDLEITIDAMECQVNDLNDEAVTREEVNDELDRLKTLLHAKLDGSKSDMTNAMSIFEANQHEKLRQLTATILASILDVVERSFKQKDIDTSAQLDAKVKFFINQVKNINHDFEQIFTAMIDLKSQALETDLKVITDRIDKNLADAVNAVKTTHPEQITMIALRNELNKLSKEFDKFASFNLKTAADHKINSQHFHDQVRLLRNNMEVSRLCQKTVEDMYTRVAAMTQLWDTITTGDLLPGVEASLRVDVKSSKGKAPAKHEDCKSGVSSTDNNVIVDLVKGNSTVTAEDFPTVRNLEQVILGCNQETFIHIMFDIQDRLSALERRMDTRKKKKDVIEKTVTITRSSE